jgi:hypothetical protein
MKLSIAAINQAASLMDPTEESSTSKTMTRSMSNSSSAGKTAGMSTPQKPSIKRKAGDEVVGSAAPKKNVRFQNPPTTYNRKAGISLFNRLLDYLSIQSSLRIHEIAQTRE